MKNIIMSNNKNSLQAREETLGGTARTIKGNLALRSMCMRDYREALSRHDYKSAHRLNAERVHADRVMGLA